MTRKEFENLDDAIAYQAAREGRNPCAASAAPTPTQIKYLIGDATKPIDAGTFERIIVHVCNDVGAWGRGFTNALDALSSKPRNSYKDAIRDTKPNSLGAMSVCKIDPTLFVANMIAQRGLPSRERRVVIDYEKLEKCLRGVAKIAADWRASCHMPRIGCGIAGGDWHTVEDIIARTLCWAGVPVYVYDLPRSGADN